MGTVIYYGSGGFYAFTVPLLLGSPRFGLYLEFFKKHSVPLERGGPAVRRAGGWLIEGVLV